MSEIAAWIAVAIALIWVRLDSVRRMNAAIDDVRALAAEMRRMSDRMAGEGEAPATAAGDAAGGRRRAWQASAAAEVGDPDRTDAGIRHAE